MVPFGANLHDFLKVEANMAARRRLVRAALHDDEALLSITNFPRSAFHSLSPPPSARSSNLSG